MRSGLLLLMLMLAMAGCKGSGVGHRVDNPVVGPPPPRRAGANNADIARRQSRDRQVDDDQNDVEQTAFSRRDEDLPGDLDGNRVVATVNGAPIFEAEVLERYSEGLNKARTQLPEEQFRKEVDTLIERDLKFHVERKLLSEEMRKSLKKDQKKQFEESFKRAFKGEIENMKSQMKVNSTAELDRQLQKQGTSLTMVEHQFRNKVLAQQYIGSKIKERKAPSRQELFAFYQQHRADYEIKARVKWQQIFISRRDEQAARAKVRQVEEGLNSGRDFGELATEFSDGPTADNKGLFDWTNKGSLADSEVEKLLFTLKVGEISEVIKSGGSYQIVRVLDREKSGHVPFEKVQDKIRKTLLEQDNSEEISALINELWSAATIDSPYKVEPGSTH